MKYELRSDHIYCEGYVCVAERESRVLRDCYGPFTERVQSGCFQRALEGNPNVQVWINHDHQIEARNYKLQEDNIGLHFEGEIYDQEVITAANQGRLRSWSYGFTCNKDSWEVREGMRYRTLEDINLFEVSLLVGKEPAYIATSVYCRDDENVAREYRYDDFEDEEDKEEEELEEAACGGAPEEKALEDPQDSPEQEKEKEEEPECPCNAVEVELINATINICKIKQIC